MMSAFEFSSPPTGGAAGGSGNNAGSAAGSIVGLIAGALTTGGAGAGVGSAVGSAIGGLFGPSYTPGGGGEVRRELGNNWAWTTEVPGKLERYIKWLSMYWPACYDGTMSVWDNGVAALPSPSVWNGKFMSAMSTTDANGIVRSGTNDWNLDQNGNPTNVAVYATDTRTGGNTGGPALRVVQASWWQRQWAKLTEQWNTAKPVGKVIIVVVGLVALWLLWFVVRGTYRVMTGRSFSPMTRRRVTRRRKRRSTML